MVKEKKDKDCAISIMKTAKTKWQKNVGEVLIEVESNIEVLKNDYKWIKWLVCGTFAATFFGLVIRLIIGG